MSLPRKRKDETLLARVTRRINHAYNVNRWGTHSSKARAAAEDVLNDLTQSIADITDLDGRAMYINVASGGKREVEATLGKDLATVNIDIDKDGNVLGVEVLYG